MWKKRQFICKYMIGNIKTIAYKLKSRQERMQTQEFIVVRRNPAYIHSLQPPNRVRVPLAWSFNQASNLLTIGLWFQFTLLDFWLQAPFTILKRYPSLEASSQGLQIMISKVYKNHSTKTLSSNDTRKARIEWCTKDMQVLK